MKGNIQQEKGRIFLFVHSGKKVLNSHSHGDTCVKYCFFLFFPEVIWMYLCSLETYHQQENHRNKSSLVNQWGYWGYLREVGGTISDFRDHLERVTTQKIFIFVALCWKFHQFHSRVLLSSSNQSLFIQSWEGTLRLFQFLDIPQLFKFSYHLNL